MPGEPEEGDPSKRGWPPGFGRGRAELDAVLVLTSLPWLRPRRLRPIVWRRGSASAALRAVRAGAELGPADTAVARATDAREVRAAVEACGARVAVQGDDEYDPRLLALADPPTALFLRGRPLTPGATRISVVGTRKPSRVGADVAETLGADLAASGVCVVSGAANGIDSCAHEGAVAVGGPTVAVLAEGIVGDRGGRRGVLLRKVARCGTVLSEAAPSIEAQRHRFPARNRLVAALGVGVIVVEGAERSGSLITVDHANDLGITVLAVPGAVTNPMAVAPIGLIRSGVQAIRHAGDVCDALGIPVDDIAIRERRRSLGAMLDGTEARVFDAVGDGVLPEQVARETGLTIAEALGCLLRLELRGLVSGDGGRYRRMVRTAITDA
ncbi:MAG: DNA-processing protein DprA [Actinomycetota bacterium]